MMNVRKWDILVIGESQFYDPDFMELLVLCGTYHKPIYLYVETPQSQLEAQSHENGGYLGDILIGKHALEACAKKKRICWMSELRYETIKAFVVSSNVRDFITAKNRYDRINQYWSLAILTLGVLLVLYGVYKELPAMIIFGAIFIVIGTLLPVCRGSKGTGSILLGFLDGA